MTKTATKRRPGRPTLPPGKKRLPSIGFRPTPKLRLQLSDVADSNNRSVSQEILARLEQSFLKEDALLERFGSRHTYRLVLTISNIIQQAELVSGKTWQKDTPTKQMVGDLLQLFFQHMFSLEPGARNVAVQETLHLLSQQQGA